MNKDKTEAKVPTPIKMACIVFILLGVFFICGSIIALVPARSNPGIAVLLFSISFIIGCAFIAQGVRAFKGKVKDTLGTGIGGILFSFLVLASSKNQIDGFLIVLCFLVVSSSVTFILFRGEYKTYMLGKSNIEKCP